MIVEITAKDTDEQPEMSSDEIIKGEVEHPRGRIETASGGRVENYGYPSQI